MENASPVSDGKAFRDTAESAYDKLAEEHHVDANGDEIVIDDDEPVLQTESEDEPELEAESDVESPDIEEEEETLAAETTDASPEETTTEEIPDLPPHTWKQEWKDTFNQIPKEGRAAMLQLNKEMNAGFTKKMMEVAGMRRDMESVRTAMQPHQDRLARAGISPEVAVQRSLAWDAHIQRNPEQGIRDMAAAYGVDLAQATASQDQQYLTPTERALQQQAQQANQSVQQVQQQIQQWQQMQQQQDQQQRQANAYNMLDQFMNATDDKGNPLHPYIEHAAPDMTRMIQNGEAATLDEAYEKAVAWNSDIRNAREQQRKAAQVRASKRKAEKVRKASGGIVDKSGKGPKSEKSFEAKLFDTYDNIANA